MNINPLNVSLIISLLFLSCTHLKPVPELNLGSVGPFKELNLSLHDVESILIEREKGFHGLKAIGRFRIEDQEQGIKSFDGVMLFKKPHMFRLQGMNLGTVIFDLISSDKKLFLYIPSEGRISKIDNPYIKYLDQIFSIISSEESLLLMEMEPENYMIYLGKESGIPLKKVWLDNSYLLPLRKEIYDPGGVMEMEISFADFRELGDGWYPYRIDMNDPNNSFHIRIDFKKIIINPDFVMRDFDYPDYLSK